MSDFKTRKANSRPLVPGGSSYAAMHLIFQEGSIRISPSFWCYILAGVLALPALFFVAVPLLTFKLWHDADLLFLGIAAVILAVCLFFVFLAILMVWRIRQRCRAFFDLSTRIFYPNGYDPNGLDPNKFPAIAFAELTSLQVVSERCSTGKSSFDSYELNLVLRNGRRFNLLDHGNKERFALDAEKLAHLLSLPLTDAQGAHFSCDSFLALPVNVRKNLLYGLGAFLVFLILFTLGDGRAWYLTNQSLQWQRIPAQVEYARVREHGGRHRSYSLDFQFRYRYQGKSYTGTDYSFFHVRSSEYDLEKIVRRYPAGKKFYCCVNPRSPRLAVVSRKIPPVWEMALNSMWTTSFLIMGIFCLLKAAAQYRLLKRRTVIPER